MSKGQFDDTAGGMPVSGEAVGGPTLFDDATDGLGPLFARSIRIEDLCERIEEVKEHMGKDELRTQADVLETIVMPLFTQLGWDFNDPRMVVSDFETPAGTVDLALCHPADHARVLVTIEDAAPADATAEAAGSGGQRTDHPFNDCDLDAIQLAIANNGTEWVFHFPVGSGSIRNREFARFDIVRDSEEEVAEELENYLAFHAVKSGDASCLAERQYRDRRFPAEAVGAWRRALPGPEILGRFLAELKEATGVAADEDRARKFVLSQVDTVEWPADPPDATPARRVRIGDRVWVYDFASRKIVERVLVDREPDWDRGEVSRDSPIGAALFGAREGEVREVLLPSRERIRARIVLIRRRGK